MQTKYSHAREYERSRRVHEGLARAHRAVHRAQSQGDERGAHPGERAPATYSASPAWAGADQATTSVASVAIPASTVTDSRDSTMRAVTFWNAPATMSTRPSAVVEARYITDMALPPTEAPDQPNSTSLL